MIKPTPAQVGARKRWDEHLRRAKEGTDRLIESLRAQDLWHDVPDGYRRTSSGKLIEITGDGTTDWVEREMPDPILGPKPVRGDGQLLTGAQFILDGGGKPVPLWGRGSQVLLAEDESLVIAGVQGTGKTTLAQQLCLGWIGVSGFEELLGFPVEQGERVLYLAMDRPRQAARSFARMVSEADRALLEDRLIVWKGPPEADLAADPEVLLSLCLEAGADLVVIDSLKDAAIGLSDDAVGAGWNRARQLVCAAGIQIIELHHLRKAPSTSKPGAPVGLDDLYGSTWITSGAGSVVLLSGKPGDQIVDFRHLKQPMAEVGPFTVLHNDKTGRSEIWHEVDLVGLVRAKGSIRALDAAKALFDTDKPDRAQKQKAIRRLDSLVTSGHLWVIDEGDQKANRPKTWAVK
jgi:replicative DNA helicase